MFYRFFKIPSFLLSLSNPLLKILPNGKYSNLACSTIPDLYPKSLTVKYSYFPNTLDDNAEVLAAFLSKSYWVDLL